LVVGTDDWFGASVVVGATVDVDGTATMPDAVGEEAVGKAVGKAVGRTAGEAVREAVGSGAAVAVSVCDCDTDKLLRLTTCSVCERECVTTHAASLPPDPHA
jgi:hypothetical protein